MSKGYRDNHMSLGLGGPSIEDVLTEETQDLTVKNIRGNNNLGSFQDREANEM